MDVFAQIAERRIREAIENGVFARLAGSGRPLALDDDAWVPHDLRLAYRVLKNAGYVPPEVELRREVVSLEDLISTIDDDRERIRAIRSLNYKLLQLAEMRGRAVLSAVTAAYEDRLFSRCINRQSG